VSGAFFIAVATGAAPEGPYLRVRLAEHHDRSVVRFGGVWVGSGSGVPPGLPRDFPPVLYVPTVAEVADPGSAEVALRRTRDGRVALLAYSALDRLRHCCGADQPWILMSVQDVEGLYARQPYDLLFLDVVIPPEHRYVPGAEVERA
jgi:hypothetical protein